MTRSVLAVFSAPVVDFMRRLARAASGQGLRLYLVGGAVRDSLLGIPSTDIDFVVDGDAIAFAKYVEKNWSAVADGAPPQKVASFPRYGTAKLILGTPLFAEPDAAGIEMFDFASARSEKYPTPGGAPIVTIPGALSDDLARRDFSINALAVEIAPDGVEHFIDQHHGERDLTARTLRVLHTQSFVDDPARMLRAVRFMVRFSLSFDAETERLFDEALKGRFLSRLPRPRLLDELRKTLEEGDVRPVLEKLEWYGMLKQIHPLLRLTHFERPVGTTWPERLRALCGDGSEAELEKMLRDFELSGRQIQDLVRRSKGAACT
ncbi:MAG: hypothetical protein U0136_05860 [Bdellovibrionota bacterium]